MTKSAAMEAPSKFDPTILSHLKGYEGTEELIANAFQKAVHELDVPVSRVAQAFLELLVQACELWDAFRKASRFRLEDRANEHASGKVAGEEHSVSALLGITRNGVYARLANLGLRPENFAYLDSVEALVSRSQKLTMMHDQLTAFMEEKKKDTPPSSKRLTQAAQKKIPQPKRGRRSRSVIPKTPR